MLMRTLIACLSLFVLTRALLDHRRRVRKSRDEIDRFMEWGNYEKGP